MSQPSCGKLWQVEASLDGRLSSADQASLDRHLPTCEECQSALSANRALIEELALLPDGTRSELAQRRARNNLMRAADELLLGRSKASPGVRRGLWMTAAVAAAAVLLIVLQPWQGEAPTMASARFEVAPEAGADYLEERVGTTTQVAFRGGKAGFHVEHLEGPARFVLTLPDGQLEVHGTRFVVEVVAGRTKEVTVSEGVVALRVPGFEGLLHAGERWPPVVVSAPSPEPAPVTDPVAPAIQELGSAPTGGKVMPAPAAPKASAEGVATAESGAQPPTAGERFAEAMAAFSAGDYGRADNLFASFVRDFPRDGRAEDAMFLRADARARRGDMAGARAAAREYLQVFPRGLRRPEAERMAGLEGSAGAGGR